MEIKEIRFNIYKSGNESCQYRVVKVNADGRLNAHDMLSVMCQTCQSKAEKRCREIFGKKTSPPWITPKEAVELREILLKMKKDKRGVFDGDDLINAKGEKRLDQIVAIIKKVFPDDFMNGGATDDEDPATDLVEEPPPRVYYTFEDNEESPSSHEKNNAVGGVSQNDTETDEEEASTSFEASAEVSGDAMPEPPLVVENQPDQQRVAEVVEQIEKDAINNQPEQNQQQQGDGGIGGADSMVADFIFEPNKLEAAKLKASNAIQKIMNKAAPSTPDDDKYALTAILEFAKMMNMKKGVKDEIRIIPDESGRPVWVSLVDLVFAFGDYRDKRSARSSIRYELKRSTTPKELFSTSTLISRRGEEVDIGGARGCSYILRNLEGKTDLC